MMDQSNACMTRACHISTVHSDLDPRIFWKKCVSLASAGYGVTLLTLGTIGGRSSRASKATMRRASLGALSAVVLNRRQSRNRQWNLHLEPEERKCLIG